MVISNDPGIWVSAILIVFAYSYIFKENPLFRIAETTMVGVAAGVMFAMGIDSIKRLGLLPLIEQGMYINIIPLMMCFMIFARFTKKYRFIARLPIAVLIGSGFGAGIMTTIAAEIIGQTTGLFSPIPSDPFGAFTVIIIPLMAVSVLLIFTYSRPHTGGLGMVTKFGTYVMMIALGANFATMTATRATYVITRLQVIFYDLLGIVI